MIEGKAEGACGGGEGQISSLLELLSHLKTKFQFSIFSTLTMVEIEISYPNHLIKPSLTYLNIIGPFAPDPNPVSILEKTYYGRRTEDGVTSSLLELLSQLKTNCQFSIFSTLTMVEIEISNPNHLTKPSLTYLNIIGP